MHTAWIGVRFGFVSGIGFAITLVVAENRKNILDLPLG
jgi:hypothetical protein